MATRLIAKAQILEIGLSSKRRFFGSGEIITADIGSGFSGPSVSHPGYVLPLGRVSPIFCTQIRKEFMEGRQGRL